MMNNTYKWLQANQFIISYAICFLLLSYLFSILWAIVLLITVELVVDNFNFELLTNTEADESSQTRNIAATTYYRKYSLNKITLDLAESHGIPDTIGADMFSKDQKYVGRARFEAAPDQRERRPSLASLIHQSGRRSSKENSGRSTSQPLLAVVKNNIHMRKQSQSQQPKSPLYKNLITPTAGRNSSTYYKSPTLSPLVHHQNSGWYHNVSQVNSPSQPGVALNRSMYGPREVDVNRLNGGLEVHGSYFLNKSLLNSNLTNEDQTFSLVNTSFNSPARASPVPNRRKVTLPDETSTEAVVSLLKEKSKRKRHRDEEYTLGDENDQYAVSARRKKPRVNGSFNDTLDELFPPVATTTSTKVTRTSITKKRMSTVSTQYERMDDENEVDSSPKTILKQSPGRGKIGLTELQTNEMMGVEEQSNTMSETEDSMAAKPRSQESEELAHAVNQVRESLSKYKESNKKKEITFCLDNVDSKDDAFSTPAKVTESSINDVNRSYSALKSLKSPYKNIFQSSFPSNLTPGSAEKRRKHPVYFTAKIDVDEIQSSREEFGERGASLKAFRLDQQEANERVDSLLEETDQVDFKVNGAAGGTSILKHDGLSNVLSSTTAASVFSLPAVTTSGLLSALKSVTTTPAITFGTPTTSSVTAPTSLANNTAKKSVTFNFQSSNSAASNSTSLPSATPSVTIPIASSTSSTSSSTLITNIIPSTTASTAFPVAISSQPSSTQGAFPLIGNISVTSIPVSSTSVPSFSFGNAPNSSTTTTTGSFNLSTNNNNNQVPTTKPNPQLPTQTFNFAPSVAPSNSVTFSNFQTTTTQSDVSNANQNLAGFQFSSSQVNSVAPSAVPTSLFPASSIPNKDLFASSKAPHTFPVTGQISSTTTNGAASNVFGVASSTNTNPSIKPQVMFPPQASTTAASQQQQPFAFPIASAASTNIFAAAPTSQATVTQSTSNIFNTKPPGIASLNTITNTTTGGNAGFNFGTPNSSTSSNIFAQPGTQAQVTSVTTLPSSSVSAVAPNAQNVFATSTGSQNTTNLFGNSSSVFGQQQQQQQQQIPAHKPVVGFQFGIQPSASTFGQTVSTEKPGFNFGTTTTTNAPNSVFGQPANSSTSAFPTPKTTSVFGQPTTTSSIFGQPTNSSSVFGQPATSSVFGQPPTTAAPSVFGQPPTTAASSVFGQPPATAASSVFGQPPATAASSVFGQPPTTTALPVFGQPPITAASSVFGQPLTTAASSVFGQPPTTAASSVFGQPLPSASSVFGQQNPSNMFGNPSTASSVFGSNTNNNNNVAPTPFGTNAALAFGSANNSTNAPPNPFAPASKPAAGFDFSSSMKPATSLAFGGNSSLNAFGTQPVTPAKPGFNFTGQKAPNFGSTPSFGTPQQPTFGTPQATAPFGASAFGAPSTPGGNFTIGASGATNPPRQTQRARRRLKK